MTADQILKKAKTHKMIDWDQKTVREAVAVREELAPKLLEHINWYYEQAQNPDWKPDEDASFLTYNGCHLLGEMKETKLYPILLQYMALPEPMLDLTFGDALTEDLKYIFANTYDGSLAETEAMVENAEADRFARVAVLRAMEILTKDGRITREELVRFLRELFQKENALNGGKYPEEETFLNSVLYTVREMHLHELCLDLRELVYGKAIFDTDYADALDSIFHWPGAPREAWSPPGLAEESEPDGPTQEEMEILGYDCGRNDPCPCGSGKKFKKCHLWVQEDLKAKYTNWKPKSIFEQISMQLDTLEPITYPSIENVGDKPGLAAYYPREAIEADVHIYRGMKIENDRPMYHEFTASESKAAIDELWMGFERFEEICQERGYKTYDEYDRNCSVHFPTDRWLRILYYDLKKQGDSRMKAVEKWIQ